MPLKLTDWKRPFTAGTGGPAAAMAMRLVAEMAVRLGAERLAPIVSAHIDGALYHGDGGVEFAERLLEGGARVLVPTTLNVGALDPFHPERVLLDPHRRAMAERMVRAYEAMGCRPTWTCAPYQAGHRPAPGSDVAWGESNAVVFCNSVLGARTNRYGDFLDICCALAGRVPYVGLHRPEERRATVVVDVTPLSSRLRRADVLFPVLGSWYGRAIGEAVGVIEGLFPDVTEDQLKALGAAAASTGAVGLLHVAGVTPEAATVAEAAGGARPDAVIRVTPDRLRAERDRLSTTAGDRIDAVALGSPHFSRDEFAALERALDGRPARIPIHACTGRHVRTTLEADGRLARLEALNVRVIVDTCVVVTPILPPGGGVLMTNSGKFAHYGPALTGYDTIFGSLDDCVASAQRGTVVRNEELWT
jgi:predicted aconitase